MIMGKTRDSWCIFFFYRMDCEIFFIRKSKKAQVSNARSNKRSNGFETYLQARIPERLNVRTTPILVQTNQEIVLKSWNSRSPTFNVTCVQMDFIKPFQPNILEGLSSNGQHPHSKEVIQCFQSKIREVLHSIEGHGRLNGSYSWFSFRSNERSNEH